MQGQELVTDLLNDPKIQEAFQVLRKGGEWVGIGGAVTKADVTLVPCSLTRLDIFDRLSDTSPPVVRANGDIAKCMEDVREGFQVSDQLRAMLLAEAGEELGEVYTEGERAEFLMRLFEHLVLGGACCQFEDKLEPYVEASKRIYKELVSAQKDPASGKPQVASAVYKLTAVHTEAGPVPLFPAASRQSFCYVAVDPVRRLAKIWYHAFVPYW